MSSIFAKNLENYLVATAELLDTPKGSVISKVIRFSKWDIEENVYYDNLDGGINCHNLTLYIPLELFKEIQSQTEQMEALILGTINKISRNVRKEALSHVTILPKLENLDRNCLFKKSYIKESVNNKFECRYDVFISHLAEYKTEAQALKNALKCFGVSAFVAHEDINPTAEWQVEIENALRGCRCLVALLKPKFKESNWTDQEVGFACARGIKIIPVIQGVNPYGFIGKIQGIKCDIEYLWWKVYEQLPWFKDAHDAFFHAISNAKSYDDSKSLAKILGFLNPFNYEEIEHLFKLSKENEKIQESHTFWYKTRHSIGMLEYLKKWTGKTYTITQKSSNILESKEF